jgi:DNA-binding NtrC family response regulator
MAATIDVAIGFAAFDDIVVVLVGESGVGKTLFAQLVHLNSPRAGGPFKDGTLVRMSEGTVESEVFGHARGAFTDARKDRAGLCLSAQHGTLFLDEFGRASEAVQRQLLALFERRAVRRLGDDREIPVNVRYLIGTNVHPRTQMERGELLPDLFHRLGLCFVVIPPLRERRDDILPLVQHFMEVLAPRMLGACHAPPVLTPDLIWMLEHAPWPGNVRQVRSAVVYLISRLWRHDVKELTPRHWPPELPGPYDDNVRDGEREVPISREQQKREVQALRRGGAKIMNLVRMTGKSRSTIQNWTRGHSPDPDKTTRP